MLDVIYYQLKAEIALEDGNLEEAKVYASLAQSAATIRRPAGIDHENAKERIRNGERLTESGGPRRVAPQAERQVERHQPTGSGT